ncbi:MAG: hypothetical protein Q4C76_01450 [Bacillota bacterium]|nr:hypothetical protein [Bacillota bacterium]
MNKEKTLSKVATVAKKNGFTKKFIDSTKFVSKNILSFMIKGVTAGLAAAVFIASGGKWR